MHRKSNGLDHSGLCEGYRDLIVGKAGANFEYVNLADRRWGRSPTCDASVAAGRLSNFGRAYVFYGGSVPGATVDLTLS